MFIPLFMNKNDIYVFLTEKTMPLKSIIAPVSSSFLFWLMSSPKSLGVVATIRKAWVLALGRFAGENASVVVIEATKSAESASLLNMMQFRLSFKNENIVCARKNC